MKPIKLEDVKMKNLMGIVSDPEYTDLLFEIVNFLDISNRHDGKFKMREVSLHTRVRKNKDLADDLNELIKLGYIEKTKYTEYKVIKHKWE